MEQGTYELEERIGGGGMAEVFRGRRTGHGGWSRPVAIKRMYRSLSSDDFSEMFVREAKLAAHLQHSNIVTVLDFARTAENELLLVMELVEGIDLNLLFEEGPVPPPVVAFIIGEVLAALAYAHAAKDENDQPLRLVHRDVTPHNVLLSWEGEVKLSDFGIAKLAESPNVTRTGTIKGKVAYLSPEQANTAPLDGRSDLFAVGIILHELLTGRRLFGVEGGAREVLIIHRVLTLPIESPDKINPKVSEALAAVCMKLLERDPNNRYQTATQAYDALLDTGAVSARGSQDLAEHLRYRSTCTDTRIVPPKKEGKPAQGTFTRALEAYEERKRSADVAFDEAPTETKKEQFPSSKEKGSTDVFDKAPTKTPPVPDTLIVGTSDFPPVKERTRPAIVGFSVLALVLAVLYLVLGNVGHPVEQPSRRPLEKPKAEQVVERPVEVEPIPPPPVTNPRDAGTVAPDRSPTAKAAAVSPSVVVKKRFRPRKRAKPKDAKARLGKTRPHKSQHEQSSPDGGSKASAGPKFITESGPKFITESEDP